MPHPDLPNAELEERLNRSVVTGLYSYPIKSCAGSSLEVAQLTPTGIAHDREFMVIDGSGRFMSQRQHPEMARIVPHIEGGVVRLEAPGIEIVEQKIATEGDIISATVWEDTVQVVDQGRDVATWLSVYLGEHARLVHIADGHRRAVSRKYLDEGHDVGFADGYPFLVTSEESRADLNRRLPQPVPMDRFRPNIVLSGGEVPYGEDYMRRIRIGDATFTIAKPCGRCDITTVDQATGTLITDKTDSMFREPFLTLTRDRIQRYTSREGQHSQGAIFGQNLVSDTTSGSLSVGDKLQVLELK